MIFYLVRNAALDADNGNQDVRR